MKIIIVLIISFFVFGFTFAKPSLAANLTRFWDIQSIDTMKFSRDEAKNKINDSSFEKVISQQVQEIAETGATHVAVATPYDDEFIPFLKKWVNAARNNHLKVWFRGNFSGWEGWFGFDKISRDQHLGKIPHFILSHPDLFESGDIFSPCTECENGGPGDPRNTGDTEGHRLFLESEYNASLKAFKKINKDILIFNSMNGDVAKLIMNPKITAALGGIVVVDHYVQTPEKLAIDLNDLAKSSGGNIVLGEFGVPIPDINGDMTNQEQAKWISSALTLVSENPRVIGVNYWTSVKGSTAIWSENGEPKSTVTVLKSFFKPRTISGRVTNAYGQPIKYAEISFGTKTINANKDGYYSLPYEGEPKNLYVTTTGAKQLSYPIKPNSENFNIIIGDKPTNFLQYVFGYIKSLFSN